MRAALLAEWLKLRSVTSTWQAMGAAALMAVLGVVWTIYAGGLADERGALQAAAPEQGFLPLLQMSLAVLGVQAVTSEYATGMMRASLTVVPRRGTLLLAKAVVVGLVTLTAGHVILLVTYSASRLISHNHRLGFNETSLINDMPMLSAAGISVTALALVGLGLGVATRSTAGAIISVVALLFVLPGVVIYLPAPWNTRAASLLLPNLVPQLVSDRLSSRLGDGLLPPWAALLVLLAYPAIALLAGFILLKRRDV
ncbi:ABC transporter permease subunit [Nonomuraea sp. NPDC052265]|uniref:ABC transporter permease subunit n=1 Tax=Nonomuraea sp. NPDC052265 TaxID=3364374 RepID=UPI0037C82138